jgi:hypothetical protein
MGGGNRKENIDLDSPSGVHILTIKDYAAEIDDGKEIDMKTDSSGFLVEPNTQNRQKWSIPW